MYGLALAATNNSFKQGNGNEQLDNLNSRKAAADCNKRAKVDEFDACTLFPLKSSFSK